MCGEKNSVTVAVWAPGPDRAGVFPAGQCGPHLSGKTASQQEAREAPNGYSSTRTL